MVVHCGVYGSPSELPNAAIAGDRRANEPA